MSYVQSASQTARSSAPWMQHALLSDLSQFCSGLGHEFMSLATETFVRLVHGASYFLSELGDAKDPDRCVHKWQNTR